MNWGYYCRTCGASSVTICDELVALWETFREVETDLDTLDASDTIATDSVDLQSLLFLAKHHRHDLWAECETGVLRIGKTVQPYQGAALPKRFRHSSR